MTLHVITRPINYIVENQFVLPTFKKELYCSVSFSSRGFYRTYVNFCNFVYRLYNSFQGLHGLRSVALLYSKSWNNQNLSGN